MRAAIMLAGGGSRRFGFRNKLLEQVGGRPLLVHALAAARAAIAGRVIVVTGADRARVAGAVRAVGFTGVTVVHAPAHRTGMGATLRVGLAALRPIEREALLFLADMPAVSPTVARMLRLRPGVDLVRPGCSGRPGHPVLVRARAARAARTAGDRGLGAGFARTETMAAGPESILDIDSIAALTRFRRRLASRASPTRSQGAMAEKRCCWISPDGSRRPRR